MLPVEIIRKSWTDAGRFAPVRRVPVIDGDGLTLGAGTRLVGMTVDPRGREVLALDADRDRLLALLVVAKAVPPAGLTGGKVHAICRASECWGNGERCLAGIHLALAGFPVLDDDDVYRLFMADGLLQAGLAPSDLVKSLNLSPGALGIGGHWADEARVPAGNGHESGRWTAGGGDGGGALAEIADRPAADEYKTGNPDKFFDTLQPGVEALAARLGIDESWLLGLGVHESGWLDAHNRRLNNPFGVTHAGGSNVGYASVAEALNYWERRFGSAVRGAISADDFVQRLRGAGYNSASSGWSSGVLGGIKSVQKRLPGWKARRAGAGA